VISALENSFPDISDDAHDEFIDHVTFEVLNASRNTNDFAYINKVIQNAIRFKKRKDAETGVNIVVGLKLVKIGDFGNAIDFLKKYRNLDTKIGTTLAFCYYALSLKDIKKNDTALEIQRPGEMELLARETMLSLASNPAHLNKVKQLEMDDPSYLEKIFWQMIFLAIEWFPSERWFIEAGLENAARSHDTEMRKVLLDISSERFYNDIQFLRVMFYHYLDKRDAGGAAGVLNHLIRQYPHDLEPIYLGLKFSLLTKKKNTFHNFRKLANSKGMPAPIVYLFDIAFDLLNQEKIDALEQFSDFEKEYPDLHYYSTTLRYIADDFFSPEETEMKKAKKAFLDSIDQYCIHMLRKKS